MTKRGAFSGAAAWPPRKRALSPGTVGPDKGNGEANVDEASAAKIAAPNKVFREREYTRRFRALAMPEFLAIERKNHRDRHFCEFPIHLSPLDKAILGRERSEQFMLYKMSQFG